MSSISRPAHSRDVSSAPTGLAHKVMDVHSQLAAGTGASESAVADVDRRRYEVVDLFKADLGLPIANHVAHISDSPEGGAGC